MNIYKYILLPPAHHKKKNTPYPYPASPTRFFCFLIRLQDDIRKNGKAYAGSTAADRSAVKIKKIKK
jgi:hypothetical protein